MGLFPEIEDQEDIERMTRNGTLAGLALALPVFGVFTTTALRLIGSDSAGLGAWFTFVGLGVFLAVPFLIACFRITMVKRRFSTVPLFLFVGLADLTYCSGVYHQRSPRD